MQNIQTHKEASERAREPGSQEAERERKSDQTKPWWPRECTEGTLG